MRKAKARWVEGLQFVGTSGSGHGIVVDTGPEHGGFDAGPSNVELLLIALCGCTGMDVVSILKKKRIAFDAFEVEAEGEVATEPVHRMTAIHITYRIWGGVPEPALKAAIELSQDRYCTVSNTLRGTAEITYEYHINPET